MPGSQNGCYSPWRKCKKTRGKWSKWLSSPPCFFVSCPSTYCSQMGIFWMDEVIEAVMGHSLQSMLQWAIMDQLSKWPPLPKSCGNLMFFGAVLLPKIGAQMSKKSSLSTLDFLHCTKLHYQSQVWHSKNVWKKMRALREANAAVMWCLSMLWCDKDIIWPICVWPQRRELKSCAWRCCWAALSGLLGGMAQQNFVCAETSRCLCSPSKLPPSRTHVSIHFLCD